jgi:hypothetical protein
MATTRRYRCRFCDAALPAWLRLAREADGAMLLGHLSQQYPDEVFDVGKVMKRAESPRCMGQKGATRCRRP